MENRNQLLDASIEKVMLDIESTNREDMVVAANRVRLADRGVGETRIEAQFDGRVHPVKTVALSQMESTMLTGFSVFGRNLREKQMRDLYLDNANRLLERMPDKRMVRMSAKGGSEFSLRAWLSTSYQRYDDDVVFGAMIDAISDTPEAAAFHSIGGYRTDSTSYLKLVTREPLFSVHADGRERAFHPGFILSNSEIGQGFCRLDILLIDRYCTNGCIFSSENLGQVKIMHRGRDVDGLISGTVLDARHGSEAIPKMERAIRTAVKTAFNQELYIGYREVMQNAAGIKIDADDDHDIELFAKHIGRVCGLAEAEHKAIAQRMLETGDRSLFGVQAALTDAAKYAASYDRKLELERAGGKIFTDVPRRWQTIKNLVAAEKLSE